LQIIKGEKLMAEADQSLPVTNIKPPFNWWKLGFFIVLLAFEMAREVAVISASTPAKPISSSLVFGFDGYIKAEGSWKRIDGGEELVPGTLAIECERETGRCIEAVTMIHDNYVYAPDISFFNATFTRDTVSFENTTAACVNYSVRIDLKMSKAFAVRTRKANPDNINCSKLENRIEMQLADGFEVNDNPAKGHFVPILSIIRALFE
jgi:hypothetical protein